MSDLTLDEARRVASAAESKALELGCAVTITVTDAGGHVRAQARLDGARFGTLNVSANKALTAAAFGVPTKILTGLTQPGQDLFGFADAAVLASGDGVHPLCAAWRVTLLPALEAALAHGHPSARVFLENLGAVQLRVADEHLLNINTPADLERAGQALAKRY